MAGPPVRVLVVDDSEDTRFLVSVVLGDADGVEVVGSADGADAALRLVGRVAPDVALVDARMPVVDGFELTPRLRAARPGLAVVLLTSHVDEQVVAAARAAGAVACEPKDDWDGLAAVVRAAVAA